MATELTKTLYIKLPPELYAKLVQAAKEDGRSVNNWVNHHFQKHFEQETPTNAR